MKLAITIWGNRVSPVFDVSGTLMIAIVENQKILKKSYTSFNPGTPSDLIKMFKRMQIDVLMCGAISTKPANLIIENNIKLISFVTGNAQKLLETFTKHHVVEKNFMMPGISRQYNQQPKLRDCHI